jgi:D-aspartate ligase
MEKDRRVIELNKHTIIIFGFEHYNPLDQIRTFGSIGICPIGVFIDSKAKFASKSKWLKDVFYVSSIEEGYNLILSKWKNSENKSFIITSDDIITSFLDERFDSLKQYFYINNCGQQGLLTYYMDKLRQKEIAKKIGFNVPKIYKINDAIESISFPVISKNNNSLINNWKSLSIVCNNREDLNKILSLSNNVFFEEYIDRSDEIAVEGYSYNSGKNVVSKLCLRREYLVEGAPGKKLSCQRLVDDNLLVLIQKYINSIHFDGVFEMEFLVDKVNKIYFSEINLRNSGLGIATTVAGASNLLGWCYACLEEEKHIPEEPKIVDSIIGMDDFADFKIRVLQQKSISFFKWNKEFKKSDFTFYFDKNDRRPFRKAIINKILK